MPVEDAKARRERIRNSMRQFYNLPEDPTVNSASGSPASAAAASAVRADAFRRANIKTAAPASAALDVDSPSFDASAYAADLLQNASIRGLYERDTSLNREIRALDGSLQELVYKNYTKFIHATDTIRQMRDNVADIDTKLDALSHNVDSIANVSKVISGNLESHRSKIEEMLTRNQMLHKIKFLIELPAVMRQAIKDGRYSDAVRDWKAGDHVFTRHSKVASFQRTHEECRAIALDLFKRLEVTVKKGSLFTEQGEEGGAAAPTAVADAQAVQPLPIKSSTNSSQTNAYAIGEPSIVVRQAISDLSTLVTTSIFPDDKRPKSFATKIVNHLYDSVEDNLKAKLTSITRDISNEWCSPFVTSGISSTVWPSGPDCNFNGGTSPATTSGSMLIFEHIITPLTNSSTALEAHFEETKKAFAGAVANIEIIEECEQEQQGHHTDPTSNNDADHTQRHRITAACQPALVTFMDNIFPLFAKVATAYLRALVHHQGQVMDSQRSAAEAAIAVKRCCEGCVQTIIKITTQFIELLKRIGIKHLQSPRGFASLVDDSAAMVFEHIGNSLHAYVNYCPITCRIVNPLKASASAPPPSEEVTNKPANEATFVQAHSVLVAALLLTSIVDRTFGGTVRSPPPSDPALGGKPPRDQLKSLSCDYKVSANALIAHFIQLTGGYFGSVLRDNYVTARLRSRAHNASPSAPHENITIMFAQWAALHAAARHWFGTSGLSASDDPSELNSITSGTFHGRSDSDAVRPNSSARFGSSGGGLQPLPNVATVSGNDSNSARMKLGTKPLLLLEGSSNVHSVQLSASAGATTTESAKDEIHVWDALKIQDSVICFTLVSLLETLRRIQVAGLREERDGSPIGSCHPFPIVFVQQLQIDLSYLLQQISPNAVFWIVEEVRVVVIFNEIITAAFNGCVSSKDALLGDAMVEKLAKDDS